MQLRPTTWKKLQSDVIALEKEIDRKGFYKVIETGDTPCRSRKSNMIDRKLNTDHLVRRLTPCRIGRSSSETCPICDSLLRPDRIGEPLRHAVGISIPESGNLVLMPNAFPYVKNHWIMVRTDHYWGHYGNARATQNGDLKLKAVLRTALAWRSGSFFFNGLCGNSLEHYHVHFTSEKLPLFKQDMKEWNMETECDINDSKGCACHRGILFRFTISNYVKVAAKITKETNRIKSQGNDINFAGFVDKQTGYLLLIERNCNENVLNFGSSELLGLWTMTKAVRLKKKDFQRVCQLSVL